MRNLLGVCRVGLMSIGNMLLIIRIVLICIHHLHLHILITAIFIWIVMLGNYVIWVHVILFGIHSRLLIVIFGLLLFSNYYMILFRLNILKLFICASLSNLYLFLFFILILRSKILQITIRSFSLLNRENLILNQIFLLFF